VGGDFFRDDGRARPGVQYEVHILDPPNAALYDNQVIVAESEWDLG
jgi:hypothetical protein